jgi:hypothetical protein
MNKLGRIALVSLVTAFGLALGCSDDEGGGGDDDDDAAAGGAETSSGGSTVGSGGNVDDGVGGEELGSGGTASGGSPSGGNGGAMAGGGGEAPAGIGGTVPTDGPCRSLAGLEDCGSDMVQSESVPINVLLVVDKSASMNSDPGDWGQTKWNALHSSLSSALNQVRGVVSWGLELFPTTAGDTAIPTPCSEPEDRCCEMPGDVELNVPVAPGAPNVTEILNQLNNTDPSGGTPTAVALQRAHEYYVNGAGADLTGERYVLLATDGAPNCDAEADCPIDTCTLNLEGEADSACPPPGDPNAANCCASRPEACLDDAGTLAQIQELSDSGIQTIVVGIPGSELYQTNLEEFATTGGFTKPDGDIGYYEVTQAGGVDELRDTFVEITTALVRECELEITQDVPNPNEVNVAVDCVVIPRGEEAGSESRWFFDDPQDPTTIIISGPICDTIQSEGVDRIDTVYGCPTIEIG